MLTHEQRQELIRMPISINVIKGGKSHGGISFAHNTSAIWSVRQNGYFGVGGGYYGLGDGSKLPDTDWRDE